MTAFGKGKIVWTKKKKIRTVIVSGCLRRSEAFIKKNIRELLAV